MRKGNNFVNGLAVIFVLFFMVVPAPAQDFCEGNFDCDLDVDGTDASVFKFDFGRSALKNPCPPCNPAQVPKTGQTTSYSPGDDGDLEKGVAWPNPRFTDNGDETVTDNLSGLIWFKNANYISTNYPQFDNDGTAGDGAVTWQHSLDFVDALNNATYHHRGEDSEDDYTYLPITYSGQSFTLTVDFDISEVTNSGGLVAGLFCDDMYQGGDTCWFAVGQNDQGRNVVFECDEKGFVDQKNYSLNNWYRATLSYNATLQVATLEIKDICTDTILSSLELTGVAPSTCISKVGMSQYGSNDQYGRVVGEIDNLSLVIGSVSQIDTDFSQDPGFTTTDPTDFYWNPGASASGDCGAVKSDWRLPNRFELDSLFDLAYFYPALSNAAGTGKWTEGDPFNALQPDGGYWSSTTFAFDTTFALGVGPFHGYDSYTTKTSSFLVWPVRGGH